MRVMWLTDIHVNFLGTEQVEKYLKRIKRQEPDALLISGDIGDAPTCPPFLEELAKEVPCPVLFVLGNHDFYHGSVGTTREEIVRLTARYQNLHYLSIEDAVPLSKEVGVVGHDSWADGRCGDFFGSRVALNDFQLINELRRRGKETQLAEMQRLAEQAVTHLKKVLPLALAKFQHVVVVTHVPPFEGATWHCGSISSPDWLPFFCCQAVGDALLELTEGHPNRQVTVLCGHTHSPGVYMPRDNMVVLTGKAEYGRPTIQNVFEWKANKSDDAALRPLSQIEHLTKRCSEYRAEIEVLKRENEQLREKLGQIGLHCAKGPGAGGTLDSYSAQLPESASASNELSKQEKIRLFQSLFRGREDVYAVRWTNRQGKSGYAPARKGKYYSRQERLQAEDDYLPLTAAVVQEHLEGKQVIGVYPLLTDETCWFLAADFDEAAYERDALSFQEAAAQLGISSCIERSRSGNGAHVWIFFSEPIPASLARQLGFAILTKTRQTNPGLTLTSYDRFFPNQDTLPKGGFGNLVALPLQWQARKSGGSLFVDHSFQTITDQWSHLATVKKLSYDEVFTMVDVAEKRGEILDITAPEMDEETEVPWQLPPFRRRADRPIVRPLPDLVRIVQSNMLFIEKDGLPPPLISRLKGLAAFQNPEFFRVQAMRMSVHGKPRIISCSEDFGRFLGLPRGCLTDLLALFEQLGVPVEIDDQRRDGDELNVDFSGLLRPEQQQAVEALTGHDIGILTAGTAFGKTVVAAAIIAVRRRNTLILVHRQQLMDQWNERLMMFLDLPSKAIGRLGAGRKRQTGRIDIAMLQSMYRKHEVSDLIEPYGQVVVDECHHISAFSFEAVLKASKAKYILGLTATLRRKDGHHPIITMQCGPSRYEHSEKLQAASRPFEHLILRRDTPVVFPEEIASAQYKNSIGTSSTIVVETS